MPADLWSCLIRIAYFGTGLGRGAAAGRIVEVPAQAPSGCQPGAGRPRHQRTFIMRVFVTGATGWIGSVVVRELLGAGHQVTGLARSDSAAARVTAAGAEVLMGSLEDTDGLRGAAAEADGVIHTGYVHDFSPTGDPAAAAALDGRVIAAFGDALAGTGKPLVVASGLPHPPADGVVTEEVRLVDPAHPRESEPAALAVAGRGVRAAVVRLP